MVIGGTNNLGYVEPLCSKGPAYDRRIKPELVAFGIVGTSGATAIVSGTCALLQEQFHKVYKRKPSSALLRALLINSADDADKPRVDYSTLQRLYKEKISTMFIFLAAPSTSST